MSPSDNIIKLAAATIKISEETAKNNMVEVPEIDGFYFWNPIRGGNSVMIDKNGEKLGATSSVSFERHLQEFLKGRRN